MDIPVRAVMGRAVVVKQEDAVQQVARLMVADNDGAAVVVDGSGRLVGIVSETDMIGQKDEFPLTNRPMATVMGSYVDLVGLREGFQAARHRPVSDIMTTDVSFLDPNASLENAVELMVQRNVKHVPIVQDSRPLGMVSRRDILRALLL